MNRGKRLKVKRSEVPKKGRDLAQEEAEGGQESEGRGQGLSPKLDREDQEANTPKKQK